MMSAQRPTLPPLHTLSLPTLSNNLDIMDNDNEVKHHSQYSRQRQLSISSSVTSASQERTPSLSPPPQHSELSSFSSNFTIRTPTSSPSPPLLPRSLPNRRPSFSSNRLERRDRRIRSRVGTSGNMPNSTFRLVPTTSATADAVLFVPPPPNAMASLSAVPSISRLSRERALAHSRDSKEGMDVDATGNQNSSPTSSSNRGVGKALLLVGPAMRNLKGNPNVQAQLNRGARIIPYKIVWNTAGQNPATTVSRISMRTTSS